MYGSILEVYSAHSCGCMLVIVHHTIWIGREALGTGRLMPARRSGEKLCEQCAK